MAIKCKSYDCISEGGNKLGGSYSMTYVWMTKFEWLCLQGLNGGGWVGVWVYMCSLNAMSNCYWSIHSLLLLMLLMLFIYMSWLTQYLFVVDIVIDVANLLKTMSLLLAKVKVAIKYGFVFVFVESVLLLLLLFLMALLQLITMTITINITMWTCYNES